jgi:hypothetical protein
MIRVNRHQNLGGPSADAQIHVSTMTTLPDTDRFVQTPSLETD